MYMLCKYSLLVHGLLPCLSTVDIVFITRVQTSCSLECPRSSLLFFFFFFFMSLCQTESRKQSDTLCCPWVHTINTKTFEVESKRKEENLSCQNCSQESQHSCINHQVYFKMRSNCCGWRGTFLSDRQASPSGGHNHPVCTHLVSEFENTTWTENERNKQIFKPR
jgi:hypothetical protein